ncbi:MULTISPECIES: NCS2 family permease [Peribacillus]|uniref:NCS2 family permease n=1 Tax=Peribacillus TaxID=2675229 RepID=UPI00177EB7E2|nr:NCS2 family permease [Peribacillus frigoritolerans]MBD8135200.1 NCS2 family permease [Bacillus sp. CFBP 13597]MDO7488233.1 NCS2 family permease [Peribacillus frigoritolerans]MED3834807.1 NCS2 family permease [Peribacillus frigoritolerans]MED3846721.1 NCS2 family permease [Peribacillus frigoritolerans]WVN13661.1 NCS2 family permease [Peribacillus frigoritolerans]
MEKFFSLKENGTDVRTEVMAGVTTFLTMVYILIVNPALLSSIGIPFEQVFMATVISAVIGTLIMGLVAKYPIAIAPGMGLNAYFASVVGAQGLSYQTVFGTVFIAGLLFLLISVTSLRKMIIDAIPNSLKYGITSGIGLFIAFIGLKNAGIVVPNESTMVTLGDLHQPGTVLALAGLFITLIFMARNIKGAIFIGMIVTAIIGYFIGLLNFDGVLSVPPTPVFFDIDIAGVFTNSLYSIVFAFLLVTIFDTTGTLIGVTEQAGLTKDGKIPRAKKAFLGDAIATTVGSMFGTSPSTAYVESSTGVAAGGRTGLTATVVAILFAVSIFFSPLISAISSVQAITAPVLIIVGCFMMEGLAKVNWKIFDEAFPAFAIILTMPLTSSISTGIAIGFITYPLMKVFSGKGKSVHPLIYIFGLIFLVQLIFFPTH